MSVEIKLLENAVKAQSERNVLKLIEHYSEIRAGHGFLTDYRQGIAKNWKPLSNDDRKTFARLGGQKIIAQREEIDDMVSKGYLPIMGEGGLSQACREVLTKLSIPIQETKLASYFSVEYLDTLDKLSAAEFKTISILINNNGVPPK